MAYLIDTNFESWRRVAAPPLHSMGDLFSKANITWKRLDRSQVSVSRPDGPSRPSMIVGPAAVTAERIRFHLQALERITKGRGRRWRQALQASDLDGGQDLVDINPYVRLQLGREVVKTNVKVSRQIRARVIPKQRRPVLIGVTAALELALG